MAGFEFTSENIIIGIRNNLHFWYKSDYAVIKELIQNADDAGARRLELGWVPGFPSATHPLLRGPAVFVLNDGLFDHTHARAIHQFAVGSKGADKTKIGKFGLGLKSVFHLCEAFIYLSNDAAADASDGRLYPRSGVLNPWTTPFGSQHPEWDAFTDADRAVLTACLRPVLPPAPASEGDYRATWFCIWLPLRRREHCGGDPKRAIESNFLGDPSDFGGMPLPPELIFGPHISPDVAQILPLLRSLERVRTWLPGAGGGLRNESQILIRPPERTDLLPQRGPCEAPIAGVCEITGNGAPPCDVVFAGHQRMLSPGSFDGIKATETWPWVDTLTEDGIIDRRPAKAEPHAAVVLSAMPAAGNGVLSIRWAVFLPLGDTPAEAIPAPGECDFVLTLHGYYFVDAGRLGVRITAGSATGKIEETWNSQLARSGTFPLVIPALEALAANGRAGTVTSEQLRVLTDAFMRSRLFVERKDDICAAQQWLPRVTGDGICWQAFPAETPVHGLPDVLTQSLPLALRTFPTLKSICDTAVFAAGQWPALRSSTEFAVWSPEMLADLLEVDAAEVVGDAEQLGFLNQLLKALDAAMLGAEAVQKQLMKISRMALLRVSPIVLRRHAELLRCFHAFIGPDRLFPVAFSAGLVNESERIALELQPLTDTVLPVSRQFLSESTPAPTLSTAVAESYLRCLSRLQPSGRQVEEFVNLRARVAKEVFCAGLRDGAQGQSLPVRCGGLALFPAMEPSTETRVLVSLNELLQRLAERCLFTGFVRLCRPLQQAMPKRKVLTITQESADLLSAIQHPVPQCQAADALRSIAAAPAAALAPVQDRVPLLTSVLPDLLENAPAEVLEAARYLLHGREGIERSDSPRAQWTELYAPSDDDGVYWSELARACLKRSNQEWRLLDGRVTRLLSGQLCSVMRVSQLTSDRVCALVSAVGTGIGEMDLTWFAGQPTARRQLIKAWPAGESNLTVLRMLPIHESVDGELLVIKPGVHSCGDYAIPPGLIQHVRLLRVDGQDELLAARQRQLAAPLDAEALLVRVLDDRDPHTQWRWILETASAVGQLPPNVTDRIRSRAWLPLADGTGIPPEQIISIPEADGELDVLAEVSRGFAQPRDLDPDVLEHGGRRLVQQQFLTRDRALDRLGSLMSGHELFHLGAMAGRDALLDPLIDVFERFEEGRKALPAAPILELLRRKFDKAQIRPLAYRLNGPISDDRLVLILRYLASQHEAELREHKARILELFAEFLAVAGASPQRELILNEIRLPTVAGTWRPAREVVVGYENVAATHRLNQQLTIALGAGGAGVVTPPPLPPLDAARLQERAADGYKQLDSYLQQWRTEVSGDLLAAVLVLLGDDPQVLALTDRYRDKYERPLLRKAYGWLSSPAGATIDAAMAHHCFLILPADAGVVEVRNVLNQKVEVQAGADVESLFDGFDGCTYYPLADGRRLHVLRLRRVDPHALTSDQRVTVLRETARALLGRVYRQGAAELDDLWERLIKSEQLDLQIAQNMILDLSMFHLRAQLGLRAEGRLKEIFSRLDRLRYRDASAEHALAGGDSLEEEKREVAIERGAIREELRMLLTQDSATRAQVLGAVRQRVTQFSYQIASIPFELLQNADDAVVELGRLLGDPAAVPPRAMEIRVEHDGGNLRFAHWGRAINHYQYGGRDFQEAGFNRDLEKMLVLSASDKLPSGGSDSTTGRFGLGFKSVFLVTDEPRVLSGHKSRFRVVAGVFPEALAPTDEQRLKGLLAEAGDEISQGTVIELPLTPALGGDPRLLDRFTGLLPYVLIFTRRIKRCTLVLRGTETRVVWEPRPLPGVSGMEYGEIDGGGSSFRRAALVFRAGAEAVLLALTQDGFVPLDGEIPTVWVTTPTSHRERLGFAVQGAFDLDVGRTQLAVSALNQELATGLGVRFGSALAELYARSAADWEALRVELGLAGSVDRYAFWKSLWDALLQPAITNSAPTAVLLAKVVAGPQAGLRRLAAESDVVPTDLIAGYRALTCQNNVRFAAEGALADPDTFEALTLWDSFAAAVVPGQIVASRVADGIAALGLSRPAPLNLVGALELELGRQHRVEAPQADRLGYLIHRVFMGQLAGGLKPGGRAEADAVQAVLRTIQFRNRLGDWADPRTLVIAHGDDRDSADERLRAAFAPPEAVLDEHYTAQALEFFRTCRGPMAAKADEMAEWAIRAVGERRTAALVYLTEGTLGRELGLALEMQKSGTWLEELDGHSLAAAGFSADQRAVIAGRLGRGDDQALFQRTPAAPPAPPLRPGETLGRIWEWWHRRGGDWTARYEQSVYPGGAPVLSPQGVEEEPRTRRPWMVLFALGAMHTMGRVSAGQNRGFLERCMNRGWFDTFAAAPERDGGFQPWARVFGDYLDEQVEQQEYFFWMGQFLSIYQLSRWLPSYVNAFWGLRRLPPPAQYPTFDLLHVTRLRASPLFEGSTGFDAPPISRVLGIGACFVLRELVRWGHLPREDARLWPSCYVPTRRTRLLISRITGDAALESGLEAEPWRRGAMIFSALSRYLPRDRVLFDAAFDLPFAILSDARFTAEAQQELGADLPTDLGEDDESEEIH